MAKDLRKIQSNFRLPLFRPQHRSIGLIWGLLSANTEGGHELADCERPGIYVAGNRVHQTGMVYVAGKF